MEKQSKGLSPVPGTSTSSFLNTLPSTSQGPNLSNFGNFNPFPAMANLQALQQLSARSPPLPNLAAFRSPPNSTSSAIATETPLGTTPLDLSSSSTPPIPKRLKLSPTSTDNNRSQHTTSPNVTTTNNNGNNSSSLESQPAQQQSTINQQPRKCQTKINEITAWNVDQVCNFVGSIDICAEYVNVSTIVSFFLLLLNQIVLLLCSICNTRVTQGHLRKLEVIGSQSFVSLTGV